MAKINQIKNINKSITYGHTIAMKLFHKKDEYVDEKTNRLYRQAVSLLEENLTMLNYSYVNIYGQIRVTLEKGEIIFIHLGMGFRKEPHGWNHAIVLKNSSAKDPMVWVAPVYIHEEDYIPPMNNHDAILDSYCIAEGKQCFVDYSNIIGLDKMRLYKPDDINSGEEDAYKTGCYLAEEEVDDIIKKHYLFLMNKLTTKDKYNVK